MIKVRVKKEHSNGHGTKARKTVNSHYELPDRDANQLAALGLVEIIDPKAAPAETNEE